MVGVCTFEGCCKKAIKVIMKNECLFISLSVLRSVCLLTLEHDVSLRAKDSRHNASLCATRSSVQVVKVHAICETLRPASIDGPSPSFKTYE